MVEREIVVKSKTGLHARPISKFVNMAGQFKSEVAIIKEDRKINGKSVLSLLTLAAGFNTKLTLCVNGEDESEAIDVLSKLLEGV